MSLPLGPALVSSTKSFNLLLSPEQLAPWAAVDLSNETSVVITVTIANNQYLLSPQSTQRYKLNGSETQITVMPTTAPPATGSVFGVVYTVQDDLPEVVSRGSNLGGSVGLPIDPLTLSAPNAIVLGTRSTSDAFDRFQLLVDGSMTWGAGGVAADIQLSRTAARTLTLTGQFVANYAQLNDVNGNKLIQVDSVVNPGAFFELTESNDTPPKYGLSVNHPVAAQTQLLIGVRGDTTSRTQEVTESGTLISLTGHIEGALNVVLELCPLSIGGQPGINFFRMTSHVTGNAPILSSVGPDPNIDFWLTTQNLGSFRFLRNLGLDGTADTAFLVITAANGVNHIAIEQSISGIGPNIHPDGPDTNIDLNLNGKGTGRIYLASSVLVGGDNGGQGGSTGLTNVVAIGNAASTNITSPAKGTGGGPASMAVAQWLKVYVGTAVGYVPWCQ